ncbi:MAG: hypothetical protein K2O81_04930 [Clostridia bacterium]|nr:hypothetical protein [Clostridia bacterium]
MKVEFLSDDLNELELVIKGNEFLKATNSDKEFHSLDLAIEAFCNFFA